MNIVSQGKALMLAMGASPVMYLMILLSIVSLGIAIERALYLLRRSDDVEGLAKKLEAHLAEGDVEGAKLRLQKSPAPEAQVVLAGLAKIEGGARAASEAMTAASTVERMKLERGLAFLGTLGNNAPFLGLFGTVIGIIMAFEQLGRGGISSGAGAPTEVMSSIAEALVATAVGLAVAIPSVALYNYFQRRIKTVLASTSALSHVLLAWIEVEAHAKPARSSLAGV